MAGVAAQGPASVMEEDSSDNSMPLILGTEVPGIPEEPVSPESVAKVTPDRVHRALRDQQASLGKQFDATDAFLASLEELLAASNKLSSLPQRKPQAPRPETPPAEEEEEEEEQDMQPQPPAPTGPKPAPPRSEAPVRRMPSRRASTISFGFCEPTPQAGATAEEPISGYARSTSFSTTSPLISFCDTFTTAPPRAGGLTRSPSRLPARNASRLSMDVPSQPTPLSPSCRSGGPSRNPSRASLDVPSQPMPSRGPSRTASRASLDVSSSQPGPKRLDSRTSLDVAALSRKDSRTSLDVPLSPHPPQCLSPTPLSRMHSRRSSSSYAPPAQPKASNPKRRASMLSNALSAAADRELSAYSDTDDDGDEWEEHLTVCESPMGSGRLAKVVSGGPSAPPSPLVAVSHASVPSSPMLASRNRKLVASKSLNPASLGARLLLASAGQKDAPTSPTAQSVPRRCSFSQHIVCAPDSPSRFQSQQSPMNHVGSNCFETAPCKSISAEFTTISSSRQPAGVSPSSPSVGHAKLTQRMSMDLNSARPLVPSARRASFSDGHGLRSDAAKSGPLPKLATVPSDDAEETTPAVGNVVGDGGRAQGSFTARDSVAVGVLSTLKAPALLAGK